MRSGCAICHDCFVSPSDSKHRKNCDEDSIVATNCGHVFHKMCIEKWFKGSDFCPECRTLFSIFKKVTKKLFINFSFRNSIDEKSEDTLQAKKLECVEKEKKIKDLHIQIKDLHHIQIKDLHIQIKDLQMQIKDLQILFASSEIESNLKDEKIMRLVTHCAGVEGDIENLLKKRIKLINENSTMKREIESLRCVNKIMKAIFMIVVLLQLPLCF